MKKLIAMLLCCVMAFSFTACGSDDKDSNTQQAGGNNQQDSQAGNQQDSQGGEEQPGGGGQEAGDALSMLTTIWDNFPGEKFACMGGNVGEGAVENAPGKFEVSDTDGLTYTLLIPESAQANLDDAASLIHMMNANTFTGAVVHVNGGDVAGVANEIKDTVLNNQFMCGFPDKLAVLTSGDYVLYAFGAEDLIDSFVSAAKDKISGVTEVHNDFL